MRISHSYIKLVSILSIALLGACSDEEVSSGLEAGLADASARDGAADDLDSDPRPDDELNVEERLPDSVWTGTLGYVDSSGSENINEWRVVIKDNTIMGEVHSSDQFGFTRESLVYREAGVADWISEDAVVGQCAASGGILTCIYAEGQPAQEVLTRTFRQRSLVWSRKGRHEQLTYEETGTLTRAE